MVDVTFPSVHLDFRFCVVKFIRSRENNYQHDRHLYGHKGLENLGFAFHWRICGFYFFCGHFHLQFDLLNYILNFKKTRSYLMRTFG